MATETIAARLKRRAVRGLAAVGALGLGTALVAGYLARRRLDNLTSLPPDGFILELDLESSKVVEVEQPSGLYSLLHPGTSPLPLHKLTEALQEAGSDARVKGLLALLDGHQAGMGLAQLQELRDAVTKFRQRAAGRAPSVAFADTFGEGGSGGTGTFYLASAFDYVSCSPAGLVSVTGLSTTVPYARGLLDKWRVTPIVFAREEYKSAMSFLKNRGSTRAEREQMRDQLSSLCSQVVRGIAAGRGLTEEQVRAAIDGAPHLASEAAALGLIDAPLFRDQAAKLVVRLHESLAPLRPNSSAALEAVVGAMTGKLGEPVAAALRQQLAGMAPEGLLQKLRPQGLLEQLLQEPDAQPQKQLKHVPIAKYAAAMEREKRRAEAGQQLSKRLAAARQAVQPLWGRLQSGIQGQAGGEHGKDAGRPAAALPQQEPEPAAAGEAPAGDKPATAALEERKAAAQPAQELPAAAAPEHAGKPEPAQAKPETEAGELPVVAVLTLTGPIHLGHHQSSPPSPFGDAPASLASLPVIKALRKARQDAAVKAVVLRVDSPGGSATASEAIHREVALLRQAGKPVVVSMGNVAASGGYYIAAAASKIVAQPATLTGSIGVIAGKLVFDAALRDQGIATETVKEGRNADAHSPLTPFTREQRRRAGALMDATYSLFKQRVAEGRSLSDKQVARLAKGRVWTGEQAAALGLVDQLGGLQAALQLAKREAGLPLEEGAVELRHAYPEHKSSLAAVRKLLRGDDSDEGNADGGTPARRAAPAASTAVAAMAATVLGRPPSAAELALLQQLQQQAQGGGMAPQCISLEAMQLAAAL